MAEKTLKTRIIQKHDTEANWLLATNFTPMNGEIIIYDEDDNHNYKRIKVGNGIDNVNVLDFYAGDWNDLKNKPKYKEETLRTIFQETDIEINEDLYTDIGILMDVKENETYFITLNNIFYECKAWKSEGDHYIYIGNGALIEQPEKGDNVPFLLDCNYQDFLVVTEPGTYKLKIETFKNYIHTSQQNLSELEQIQTLINLDLILFEQIGNPIKIKMSNFDENGYYYFNDKEKEKIAVGYSDYKIYAGYNEYEDIGIIEKLKGNHHISSASIYFKDFLLNNDYIQILRKDVNFSFDEFYLMPGKIKIKYDINPTNDVYLTQEELEDGTKIVYFSQSFKWIYSSIVESQQMVIFREDNAYYLPIEITTGNLKIQGIKDNKIVTIDWNSNEEYGYVTEKNLSSSWNDLEDRPFYEEVAHIDIIDKNIEFGLMDGSDSLYMGFFDDEYNNISSAFEAHGADFDDMKTFENMELTVIFDSVEYNTKVQFMEEMPIFGNMSIYNAVLGTTFEDTGEPFIVALNQCAIMSIAGGVTHSVKITAKHSSIVKIPSKYIDSNINVWNGLGEDSVLLNTTYNKAIGERSLAEGHNTTASGDYSHAEGNTTKATGHSSHAEGYDTTASGAYSHVEGNITEATAMAAHAEGSITKATAMAAHAEGTRTKATGHHSHAEGLHTTAVGQSQHVQGEYNVIDVEPEASYYRSTYAHIVGNGTAEDKRSNAHTLDWDGNAWFAGDVYVGGTSQSDGSKLITEAKVDEKISEINIPEQDLSGYALKSEIPSIAGLATEAYADNAAAQVKNDLLNGAGAAYDTLKELGDLIDVNVDAIEALETVASGKADKVHTHDQYLTEHQDLSNYALKSELPSTTGLASESYVDEKIESTEARIDELFQNVSSGKELIASAITDKGVYASDDETFQELSDKIGQIIVGPPGTNIIGYIDEENDIYLSLSELENGTYTLKLEDNNGLLTDFDDIGEVEVA